MLTALPPELLETTSKAIRSVASRLPPFFAMAPVLQLSPFAMTILLESPPNSVRLSFGDYETKSFSRVSNTERSRNPDDKQLSKIRENRSRKTPARSNEGSARKSNADKPISSVDKKLKRTPEKVGCDQISKKYNRDERNSNALKSIDDAPEKTQSFRSLPSPKATNTVGDNENPSPPTARQ